MFGSLGTQSARSNKFRFVGFDRRVVFFITNVI